MAIGSATSLALKLVVVLFTIAYHNQMKLTRLAEAQLMVTPLWNTSAYGNDSQPCFVHGENQNVINLRGSAYHTCRIEVTTPLGSNTLIQIPKENTSETYFLYVERRGAYAYDDCSYRYVAIGGHPDGCIMAFEHNHLQLYLQGNVSLLISNLSAVDSLPRECPEPEANQISDCYGAKGYNEMISCNPMPDPGTCALDFPSNCYANLGNREVVFQCPDSNSFPNQPILIDYPHDIDTLNLNDENIVDIDALAFSGLTHLHTLSIAFNMMDSLEAAVFDDLKNLNALNFYENQLATLDAGLFQDLNSLTLLNLLGNKLRTLPPKLFHGLHNLRQLYLQKNHLTSLKTGLFQDTTSLVTLNLGENNLTALPVELFQGLENLRQVYLQKNMLTAMKAGLFQGLTSLELLQLGENNLTVLPVELFRLKSLSRLYLHRNWLASLEIGLFRGLSSLVILYLPDNNLSILGAGLFQDLGNLRYLYLQRNQLIALDAGLFQHLTALIFLNLGENHLHKLPGGLLQGLKNLEQVNLGVNLLNTLEPDSFQGLHDLRVISLLGNELVSLDKTLFNSLSNLEVLSLQLNHIEKLGADVFRGLINLKILHLASNKLTNLDPDVFKDTQHLTHVDISENKLQNIPHIQNLTHLLHLDMQGNALKEISRYSFAELQAAAELYASQHEVCECYVATEVTCHASDQRSPYLTCDRLLSDRVLMAFMWVIGLNALGGNFFVLTWRQKTSQKNKVQTLLLSNLATSDLLMGIYMIIIASADIYFGEYFPMQSETWRSGITCRTAGALAILSSEGSVLFITLISIDRLMSIKFPHSSKKLNKKSATVSVVIIWLFAFMLGTIPSIFAGLDYRFYDNSHICVGLPLAITKMYSHDKMVDKICLDTECKLYYLRQTYTTQSQGFLPGMYFSTVVFLGFNCICYLIILGCYVAIVITVYKSSKRAGLNQDMREQLRMTAKVAAIIVTDFICWFPIILLGILVQANVTTLPPSVFAWCVTFVLPINSAINPYLYTIAAIINNRRKQKENSENTAPGGSRSQQQQRIHNMRQVQPESQTMTSSISTQHASVSAGYELQGTLPNVPMHQRVTADSTV